MSSWRLAADVGQKQESILQERTAVFCFFEEKNPRCLDRSARIETHNGHTTDTQTHNGHTTTDTQQRTHNGHTQRTHNGHTNTQRTQDSCSDEIGIAGGFNHGERALGGGPSVVVTDQRQA